MNEQTRYRVTGSLFLFAVGVVVLPMLFDGDGLPAIDVPPVSEVTITPLSVDADARARLDDRSYLEPARSLRQRFDDEGFDRRNDTRFGEPVLRPISPQSAAFAVQLGAFAERDNAIALRDRVRDDGFEAFTTTTKGAGTRHTRVAVGPYLDRARAEAELARLSNRYGLKARLMAFSDS